MKTGTKFKLGGCGFHKLHAGYNSFYPSLGTRVGCHYSVESDEDHTAAV